MYREGTTMWIQLKWPQINGSLKSVVTLTSTPTAYRSNPRVLWSRSPEVVKTIRRRGARLTCSYEKEKEMVLVPGENGTLVTNGGAEK